MFAKKFSKFPERSWVFVVVVLARSLPTALHSLSWLQPPGPGAAVSDPQEPGTVCAVRIVTPTAIGVSLGVSQGFWYPGFCRRQGWTGLRANLKSHRKKLLPLGSVIREVTALPGFHLNITVALRRSGFFFFSFRCKWHAFLACKFSFGKGRFWVAESHCSA